MKILVVRFSSIGDIVLTSPVVRCLRQQLGAEVHFLTKSAFASVAAANPYVSKVWTWEDPAWRAADFDWVIDLHHNLRSLRVKWALRRPSRSFDKLNFAKWLLVNTGLNRLPQRHIVDRYLDTVAHLGVQYDGLGLDFFIPPTATANVAERLSNLSQLIQHQTLNPNLLNPKPLNPNPLPPFVAFVIGATHATKRLPPEMIADACRRIRRPVILLGGPAEAAEGAAIAAAAGAHVVNWCGMLNLNESAAVVAKAHRVITHDTGLMHIAAALRRPVVAVWGNTVPEFGMYPLYPTGQEQYTNLEIKDLRCRPCSKIGHSQCPKGHFACMRHHNLPLLAALANA